MTWMKLYRQWRAWVLGSALLSLVGCSRPGGVPTEGAPQASQAPFQDHVISADRSDSREPAAGASGSTGPPFRDSQTVPPGTLVTVRLVEAIAASGPGNSFEAVVDHPVVVDGNTLIPRGVAVVGRVQSTGVSKAHPTHAYVRLDLETLHVGATDVPLQTASLFAREYPQDASTILLEKGRRLTFRLAQGVYIAAQHTPGDH